MNEQMSGITPTRYVRETSRLAEASLILGYGSLVAVDVVDNSAVEAAYVRAQLGEDWRSPLGTIGESTQPNPEGAPMSLRPCACGSSVVADPANPSPGVRMHQTSPGHLSWRAQAGW